MNNYHSPITITTGLNTVRPAKTNTSSSSGAGVFAQYSLHICNSLEEFHRNRSRKLTQTYIHLKTP
ncbi:Bgt-20602 [Blumeria graminis f. sp. tritici]|uniref:Bgt-20602 n=2 Tax=Blumeria graminis f. sp. tritici TaxID=62690 RepID=A0A9X9MH06_BLUGR|nr:Bgt-20602 [Blumeria graminis f. sp. tritici]